MKMDMKTKSKGDNWSAVLSTAPPKPVQRHSGKKTLVQGLGVTRLRREWTLAAHSGRSLEVTQACDPSIHYLSLYPLQDMLEPVQLIFGERLGSKHLYIPTITLTSNLESPIFLTCFSLGGGSEGTYAQGLYKENMQTTPGIKPMELLALRQQCLRQ